MDAVKLLKEAQRMCIETECCEECPICEYCAIDTDVFEVQEPEKVVKIIEKWANEHPVKTRQSEFLKRFPNATPFHIDPCNVDADMAIDSKCRRKSCIECREEYWNTEVE